MKVLIVDDEVGLRVAIERRLRKDAIETGSASTVRQALERLRAELFDIVVCDLRMPGGDGSELIEHLVSSSPSTRIVVVSGFIDDEFRNRYGWLPQLSMMEKPLDLDALVARLRELGPRKGFYGNAIEVELFDYVQMIALTGRDKLVKVSTSQGDGLIWFEHGDIVHVEYDQFRGELAFYKLLAVGRGDFQEVFGGEPPMRTVLRSSTHLLMEAARQADEGTLGHSAPDAEVKEVGSPEDAEGFDETSFEDLNDELDVEEVEELEIEEDTATPEDAAASGPRPPRVADRPTGPVIPTSGFEEMVPDVPSPSESAVAAAAPPAPDESAAAMSTASGHAVFEDPETRNVMLEQFWQFDGINGVAIISSTGKVLAEDMRSNSSLVTLAGFYMRGAARIARTLGHNVFDGVVARSVNGQQMVMVSMGAASAVLSVEPGADPEQVRDLVMGVE